MKKTVFSILLSIIFCRSYGQVPVREEPMHHLVLNNPHVRLLDVHILPGDSTRLHIHATPSVFLILTPVKTGSQVIQEEDQTHSPVTHYGNIYFESFSRVPRIHRVWNSDTSEFRVMDIELPNLNFLPIDPVLTQTGFEYLFDEVPVRVYRLHIKADQSIKISPRKADILIIGLDDLPASARCNGKLISGKGDFVYIPSGESVEFINTGNPSARFAFLELK